MATKATAKYFNCFKPSSVLVAQMLRMPAPVSTNTATSTGQLLAIASCCHNRRNIYFNAECRMPNAEFEFPLLW